MKNVAATMAILLAVSLAGCASGPKFSDAQATLPPTPESEGRVYFYRTQTMGAAVQPSIYLNGQAIGTCEPDGVFVKDLAPGRYEAVVGTEVTNKLTFVVVRGQEKFVKCSISMGVFVGHPHLELVDPSVAKPEIQSLSLTGFALIQKQ